MDRIWKSRPRREAREVVVHGQEFAGTHLYFPSASASFARNGYRVLLLAGETTRSKFSTLRRRLIESSSYDNLAPTSYLVSSLANIAYLLNLRGSDIDFNPVFYSYLLINASPDLDQEHNANGDILFVQPDVLSSKALTQLEMDGIEVRNYDEVEEGIKGRKVSFLLRIESSLQS